MDEKLRKKLCDFLQCECDYGETHCASIDYLEQAFRDAHWIEPQQPEGLNKEKLPLEVYNRFEWFWYEPEVTEILDDLYSGESEAVSKLTDRILALNGEGWRVAIITKPKREPQQPEELVKSDIYRHSCITLYPALVMAKCHACVWDEATLAQLAHDKQRMVKLPSEDELALWLCDHLSYTSRELAYELLRLLGGKK